MPWFVNESSLQQTPYPDYPCLDQSRPSLSPARHPPSNRLSYCVEGVVEQGLITPDSLPLVDTRSCLHMLIVNEKQYRGGLDLAIFRVLGVRQNSRINK